ncbi:hypothetical protein BS17DRAFT_766594 [Gyrodon lividus]|nr:hypothetical protein BS17DRAFT_766594 [Gyrodon lividus]
MSQWQALRIEVEGSITKQSIGWIMREGGIASNLQLVDEIQGTKGELETTLVCHDAEINAVIGITLSSDGTSHKNIQYQGHHVTYTTLDGENVTHFLGITHEVNHTSQIQLEGWKELIQGMYETFSGFVRVCRKDHAEDQNKLARLFLDWKCRCDRELRGENALATLLPPSNVTHAINQIIDIAVKLAGGPECWDKLSPAEQYACTDAALHQFYFDIKKESIDFFVWAGCCMHKELNTVKGGDKQITSWWQENCINGPILLMNRDNTSAATAGSSEAWSCALQISGRGAVKALNLTGAVFCHKDNKKGTSNTHYQSHCNAATFFCPKMAEEMACLSLWGNCIGHPYMHQVCGSLFQASNLLDLGPLHSQVADHLWLLISNLDLIIGPSASFETAALDARPFEHPEAFDIVKAMANNEEKSPPSATPLCIPPGGVISKATSDQRALAHMETSNDANEGVLGTLHIFKQRTPRMSLTQFNAQQQYKKNNTGSYVHQLLTWNTCKNLQKQAQVDSANGAEQKHRLAQVAYDLHTAKKNKVDAKRKCKKCAAAARKLNDLTPVLIVSELAKMCVTKINLQICWHHIFDPKVPRAKDLPS